MSLGLPSSAEGTAPRAIRRDRSREGAGKSERSYVKHEHIRRVVSGQIAAYRFRNPGRIAIIDGNAGDGSGVELPQLDLFDDVVSTTTAELAVGLSEKYENATVILCESDRKRRVALRRRFPASVIVKDNALAAAEIPNGCAYTIWISDPNGPKGHGVEAMCEIARSMRSDFVIAFNERWILERCAGLTCECEDEAARRASITMHSKYLPMVSSPTWWAEKLGRRRLSRTPVIPVANNFKCRIIVAANYLSDAASRRPFEVIL